MVEWLRDQSPGTLGNLAGSLDRAYAYILPCFSNALADVFGRSQRMQRNQIPGPFTDSLRGLARPLAGTFADISAAASDITTRASTFGWSGQVRW